MRAFACLAAVAALVTACATGQAPVAPSHSAIASDLAGKTVALVVEDRAYCSGVWVSDRFILTARHCVDDLEVGAALTYALERDVTHVGEFEIVSKRGATLLAVDEGHDLALLYSAAVPPSHGVAAVSTGTLNPGDVVFTMGAPVGLWWSYSSGEIAAVRYLSIDPPGWYVQTTAPISPGSSGGGLFDAQGRIVGVCHGSFTRGQLLNVHIHRTYVASFLHAQGLS